MKTLLLTAVITAAGTPVLAQNWNHNNFPSNNCGSTYQNYGRGGSMNGYPNAGYGPGQSYGYSPYRGSTHDSWSYRHTVPNQQRSVYDPVHGDFHSPVNLGYSTPSRRSVWDNDGYWINDGHWNNGNSWNNSYRGGYRY